MMKEQTKEWWACHLGDTIRDSSLASSLIAHLKCDWRLESHNPLKVTDLCSGLGEPPGGLLRPIVLHLLFSPLCQFAS